MIKNQFKIFFGALAIAVLGTATGMASASDDVQQPNDPRNGNVVKLGHNMDTNGVAKWCDGTTMVYQISVPPGNAALSVIPNSSECTP